MLEEKQEISAFLAARLLLLLLLLLFEVRFRSICTHRGTYMYNYDYNIFFYCCCSICWTAAQFMFIVEKYSISLFVVAVLNAWKNSVYHNSKRYAVDDDDDYELEKN